MARSHRLTSTTLAIANGATTSGTMTNLGGGAFGLALPAAFTGASISFLVSADNATFTAIYDASNALVSQTVTQGRAYALPAALAAWPYWQIVSASSEGAARTLTVTTQT